MIMIIFSFDIAPGLKDQAVEGLGCQAQGKEVSARDVEDSSKASIQLERDRISDTVARLQAWIDNPFKLILTWKRRGRLTTACANLNHCGSRRRKRSVLIEPPRRIRSLFE